MIVLVVGLIGLLLYLELTMPKVSEQIVEIVARAIAKAEGFGIAGAVPTRANNPGDLTQAGQGYAGDTGQTLGANIIVFDTVENGWNALYRQVRLMLSGGSGVYSLADSIEAVAAKYTATDAGAWAQNVADALGVDPSVTLGQLSGVQT